MQEQNLGWRLRYERIFLHLTQKQLAEKIRVSVPSVERWENNRAIPRADMVKELCKVFGKPLGQWGKRVVWNIPFLRNVYFTGREQILARLHAAVGAGQMIAPLLVPYAISGLGGIGKTQTALEYAYRYAEEYETVLWIRADSHDLLVSEMVAIADLLALPERQEANQTRLVQVIKRWLEEHEPWLLIFDNADDIDMVEEFFPRRGIGAILLTTRSQLSGPHIKKIVLDKMSCEETMSFLLRRIAASKGEDHINNIPIHEQECARQIWEIMDGLPLALDQVAAYVEERQCSLADYLDLYKTRHTSLLQQRGMLHKEYPESVATTWSLSFERIKQESPMAAELLRLCSFLHPDAIPEELLVSSLTEIGTENDLMAFNDSLGILLNYSLVRRNTTTQSLTLHRLVQTVLRDAMNEETQKTWIIRVVQLLSHAFPSPESASWLKCQRLIAHVEVSATYIQQYHVEILEAVELLSKAGRYLHRRSQYADAERFLLQAWKLREKLYGEENTYVAKDLLYLASIYLDKGNYEQAEHLYQRSLTILEQVGGSSSPDVAEVFNGMGLLYWKTSRYGEAESIHKKALVIREQTLDLKHQDIAESLNNLALIYHYQEYYAEAEVLYERAMTIWKQTLGLQHSNTITAINNLGILYCLQGKYSLAEEFLKQAIDLHEQLIEQDHVEMALSIFNLALTNTHMRKQNDAEQFYKQALAIWERTVGSSHPVIAVGLNGLGLCYLDQGRFSEAEPVFLRALAIHEQNTEIENGEKANSIHGLAEVYLEQEDLERAEKFFLHALRIRGQGNGRDTVRAAQTLSGLGRTYFYQKRFAEAESILIQVLRIREKKLGEKHFRVAQTMMYLGALYHEQRNYTEAERLLLQAKAIYMEVAPTHFLFALNLFELAMLYENQGQYLVAEACYQQALVIQEQSLGMNHPHLARSLEGYARLLQKADRAGEATTMQARATTIRQRQPQ